MPQKSIQVYKHILEMSFNSDYLINHVQCRKNWRNITKDWGFSGIVTHRIYIITTLVFTIQLPDSRFAGWGGEYCPEKIFLLTTWAKVKPSCLYAFLGEQWKTFLEKWLFTDFCGLGTSADDKILPLFGYATELMGDKSLGIFFCAEFCCSSCFPYLEGKWKSLSQKDLLTFCERSIPPTNVNQNGRYS